MLREAPGTDGRERISTARSSRSGEGRDRGRLVRMYNATISRGAATVGAHRSRSTVASVAVVFEIAKHDTATIVVIIVNIIGLDEGGKVSILLRYLDVAHGGRVFSD